MLYWSGGEKEESQIYNLLLSTENGKTTVQHKLDLLSVQLQKFLKMTLIFQKKNGDP